METIKRTTKRGGTSATRAEVGLSSCGQRVIPSPCEGAAPELTGGCPLIVRRHVDAGTDDSPAIGSPSVRRISADRMVSA